MSAPFVNTLRSRPEALRIAPERSEIVSVRVQSPDVWDVVRIDASPDDPVSALKLAAMGALLPNANHEQYMMKLRGFEILDEFSSIASTGAVNGSTFLLMNRRRRPAR